MVPFGEVTRLLAGLEEMDQGQIYHFPISRRMYLMIAGARYRKRMEKRSVKRHKRRRG